MNNIDLFIVEDQPAILRSQVLLLGRYPEIKIVGSAMSGEEAVKKLSTAQKMPDVVLCDLGLPKMSGIEVIKHIKALRKKTEILVFTVFEEEDKVLKAIKAGASGYLLKGTEIEKIHEAIVDTFHGGSVIQPSLARKLLKHFCMPLEGVPQNKQTLDQKTFSLTAREIECLQIIGKGLSNNEAAEVLNLSLATIRTHLEHIYQKLEVSNRVEAVTEGIRQGMIEL